MEAVVSLALRDTETCTAAVDVREVSKTGISFGDERRILAVVTHRNINTSVSDLKGDIDRKAEHGGSQEEEGCLFIMRYRSFDLYPYMLFPIDSNLTASIKQRDGVEGTDFEVRLKDRSGNITLSSKDMHSLSIVLEETRRLKKLIDPDSSLLSPASPHSLRKGGSSDSIVTNDSTPSENIQVDTVGTEENEENEETHWEWLHFYLSHRANRLLPSQQPKPRDIRVVKTGIDLSRASAGLPGDEALDMTIIRDEWIHEQLLSRRQEYSTHQVLRLRIGTFNVNNRVPVDSLVPWIRSLPIQSGALHRPQPSSVANISLKPNSGECLERNGKIASHREVSDTSSIATSAGASSFGLQNPGEIFSSSLSSPFSQEDAEDLPDLFILGFQELDNSTEAMLYSTPTMKEEAWTNAVLDALGKNADRYIKLASKRLAGIFIIVIILKEREDMIKEVSLSNVGTGLMGIMGNKGAVAVRLRLNSTAVTFVCSHLAAFDDYAEKRNSDFAELSRRLEFPLTWRGTRNAPTVTANVWETDVLFWLVNLNYRIDLPDEEVREMLMMGAPGSEYETLMQHDQLQAAIRHKRAFMGFTEKDIKFPPTYRFGDLLKDKLGYDFKRRPAWTDRIMYISAESDRLIQTSYQSHPMITTSDHRPVSAEFNLIVDDYDPHKYHQVARSVFKAIGDYEDSEEVPTVTVLDSRDIDFGEVSYLRSVSRCVRIKNEGKIPCAFRFVSLEPNEPICKEWLKLEPLQGLLLPGEIISINITIAVDKHSASFLNHKNVKLEDTLILHLAKGSDHVISVTGSYLPTCFANSIAWLVRSPGPIRTHGNSPLLPESRTLSAPRELMFLVEWLITNAQDIDDLFLVPANPSLVTTIREYLDTQPLDSGGQITFPPETDRREIALAYAETLKEFLDSLTEPVIPWVLHPRCALAQDREDVFAILDDIPGFSRNVFVTVTAFLHFIGQQRDPGVRRSQALARVFANILLRDNPRTPPGIPLLTPLKKRNFLLYTIA